MTFVFVVVIMGFVGGVGVVTGVLVIVMRRGCRRRTVVDRRRSRGGRTSIRMYVVMIGRHRGSHSS
jgi:hypothetical protein